MNKGQKKTHALRKDLGARHPVQQGASPTREKSQKKRKKQKGDSISRQKIRETQRGVRKMGKKVQKMGRKSNH